MQETQKTLFGEGELPPGLPEFVYDAPAELTQAVYVDQIKPRKKARKEPFQQQLARDGEPDEVHGMDEAADQAAPQDEKHGQIKRKAAIKPSIEAAPKPKKRKAEQVEVKPLATCQAAADNEASGQPHLGTSAPDQETAVPISEKDLAALSELTIDELQILYDAEVAEPWVGTNNVYSSAYRKATMSGLTKQQAQLRGKISTAIFRKEKSRLFLPQLAGPFRKPRAKKVKAADSSPKEKPADGNHDEDQGGNREQ